MLIKALATAGTVAVLAGTSYVALQEHLNATPESTELDAVQAQYEAAKTRIEIVGARKELAELRADASETIDELRDRCATLADFIEANTESVYEAAALIELVQDEL